MWALLVLLLLPVLVIVLECSFALLPKRINKQMEIQRPKLAVLIPAHNEAAVIADTLASLIPQLGEDDRLLVVADNCTDDTAAIATLLGSTVIERHDEKNKGKGFALAHGIDELRQNSPAIVIMIDADCIVANGSIDTLARSAVSLDSPVQALYLMNAGQQSSLKIKVAAFAWVFKNLVRARGLSRFNLPVQMMGTGMAFPWHIIEKAELASDAIVEDMQMGIALALQGHKTHFCLNALVSSKFPETERDAGTQRRRWEHGHINMILAYVPQLFSAGLYQRDIGLLALGLDLMVPPLALQSVLLMAGLVVMGLAIPFGISSDPFMVLLGGCILFALVLTIVWYRFARAVITLRELMSIPAYIFSKLSVYTSYFFSRESKWIRTGRGDADD